MPTPKRRKNRTRWKLVNDLERICNGILSGQIKRRYAIMRLRRLSAAAKKAEAREKGA